MTRKKTRLLRGLEKVFRPMAMVLAVVLFATANSAAAENQDPPENAPGDIIITAAGADGAALFGVSVRLILPGPDGSLDKAPNLLFEAADGGKYDADGARNGAVVFSEKILGGYADDESGLSLDVSLKGYVPQEGLLRTYHKEQVNAFAIELQKQNSGKQ